MIVECSKCNAIVEANEIANFQYLRNDNKPSGRYVFLKCIKCDSPILINQENIGNMADGDIWDKPLVLFPRNEYKINPEIPSILQDSINEAHLCYKINAYTATVIMCRRALECICSLKSVSEKNLNNSIKKLKDDGIIDNQLFEWADVLRITGNEAAHDINTNISKEDAKDILDFTNAMAEYIFMFKEKLDGFRKRRLTIVTESSKGTTHRKKSNI